MSALAGSTRRMGDRMQTIFAYVGAAVAEIAGCFAFWAWLRLDKPVWWVFPGTLSLLLFAYLLTLVESAAAGRAYAAYGGIYIAASLACCGASKSCAPIAGTSPARFCASQAPRSLSQGRGSHPLQAKEIPFEQPVGGDANQKGNADIPDRQGR